MYRNIYHYRSGYSMNSRIYKRRANVECGISRLDEYFYTDGIKLIKKKSVCKYVFYSNFHVSKYLSLSIWLLNEFKNL